MRINSINAITRTKSQSVRKNCELQITTGTSSQTSVNFSGNSNKVVTGLQLAGLGILGLGLLAITVPLAICVGVGFAIDNMLAKLPCNKTKDAVYGEETLKTRKEKYTIIDAEELKDL